MSQPPISFLLKSQQQAQGMAEMFRAQQATLAAMQTDQQIPYTIAMLGVVFEMAAAKSQEVVAIFGQILAQCDRAPQRLHTPQIQALVERAERALFLADLLTGVHPAGPDGPRTDTLLDQGLDVWDIDGASNDSPF